MPYATTLHMCYFFLPHISPYFFLTFFIFFVFIIVSPICMPKVRVSLLLLLLAAAASSATAAAASASAAPSAALQASSTSVLGAYRGTCINYAIQKVRHTLRPTRFPSLLPPHYLLSR